ncbi:MAG: hypothetical protein M1536_00700 [Firmicutes bacterium]|nr:hypothetical protein [Bacillota bacterium]
MCTLIAIIDPNPDTKILFFENRDKPDELFQGDEMRVLQPNNVVALFDRRSGGIVAGYSAETGVFGGVTNVPGYPAKGSRGVVLMEVLTESANLHEAISFLRGKLPSGHYSSANYILGSNEAVYKLESFGKKLHVSSPRKRGFATNNFVSLTGEKIIPASRARFNWLEKHFIRKRKLKLEDFLHLGSFHNEKVPDAAVCRHSHERLGYTVSSFVFEITKEGKANFYYAPGPPCTYKYEAIFLTS